MGILIKIVVLIMNVVFTLISFLTPSETTAFAVLPVIVVSSYWIVEMIKEKGHKISALQVIMITLAALVVGFSLFVGLTCDFHAPELPGENFIYTFNKGMFCLANKKIQYGHFFTVVFLGYLIIAVSEVIVYAINYGKQGRKTSGDLCFDELSRKYIRED